MAESHQEVQAQSKRHRTDLTDEEALESALFPEGRDVYDGPGAYTVNDMIERYNITSNSARYRARTAVERGVLVEVVVERRTETPGAHPTVAAWVPVGVYKEWIANGELD